MMSKFPGSDHSCRRRYVAKLLAERRRRRRIITRYTSARQYVMPCESGRRSRDRRSADCQTTFFRRFKQFGKIFEKSRWTVTRQWSEVTRPSADCQTTIFGRFKQFGKIFWKKSLNGHATVVGGHATVGRLSNNVFWTFQAIWENFEKSRWTVTRQWSEVTRPSADCQTTFFGRFKQFGKILKKVAERSRDSGRRSRDRRPTVKQRFLDVSSNLGKFWKKSLNGHATVVGGHATVGRLSNNVFWTFQAIWENFEKSRWTVTRQWSEVTRPSADCQTTFFGRFKQLEILKKVAERSRDSGRRSRDRRPTVKQRFLDVSSNLGKFWKKSLNGHATVVGGHATVGRLSNNVFWTFQAIRKIFEKSRWTVTRQWSEVTRPSADCQTTFFGRFKRFGKILKKVAERSRDSGRRSRDRRPTVKQRFLDVSSDLGKFWKKSLNGHATVVGGHATVGRLSNNVFWTFQAIWENFEKSRWTVTRQWSEVTRPSADCQTTFFGRFKQFGKILKKVAERSRDSGRRSRDRRPTVKQRFLDVSSN